MENKVSITLSQEVIDSSLASIATLTQALPTLISLSNESRQTIPKMGDKSFAFVSKALEYSKQNPTLNPSFLDVAEFELDVKAVESLTKVLNPLLQLVEMLSDTQLLAGSEAYTSALIFYNSVKSAAKSGVPGTKTIYDDLQTRFPGRSKTSKDSTPLTK